MVFFKGPIDHAAYTNSYKQHKEKVVAQGLCKVSINIVAFHCRPSEVNDWVQKWWSPQEEHLCEAESFAEGPYPEIY